jgi:predicted flavoprotein YhiN
MTGIEGGAMRTLICFTMAFMMSSIPHLAAAEVADHMISTAEVVGEMGRAQTQAKIEEMLSQEEIRTRLAKAGVSQEEISKRLATLSDQELRQLSDQIEQAKYAGDGLIGILVIVVLVLLVIYLAKRI